MMNLKANFCWGILSCVVSFKTNLNVTEVNYQIQYLL